MLPSLHIYIYTKAHIYHSLLWYEQGHSRDSIRLPKSALPMLVF